MGRSPCDGGVWHVASVGGTPTVKIAMESAASPTYEPASGADWRLARELTSVLIEKRQCRTEAMMRAGPVIVLECMAGPSPSLGVVGASCAWAAGVRAMIDP